MIRSLLIGCVIFLFLVFLPFSFAKETKPFPSQISSSPVEYSLPFPGILPDHPLYILKRLRDQALILLITNPVKKAEFYILLADKQLNMSQSLFEKNKFDLTVDTLAKSSDYLRKAQDTIFKLPSANDSAVANVKYRLEQSMIKHLEILAKLEVEMSDTYKDKLGTQTIIINKLLDEFRNKK